MFCGVFFSLCIKVEWGSTKPTVVRSSAPIGDGKRFLYRRCGSKTRELFDWLSLKQLPFLGKPNWLL